MFIKTLKSTLIAAGLTLGAVAATSGTANAGDIRGGFYIGGPGIQIGIGDFGPRFYRWDNPRYEHRRVRRNFCHPRRALKKAKRKGLRRAHVVRIGHRGVVVAGRKWGERIIVNFRNNRKCSVRFVRAVY